jgi:hypothetical protein
VSKHVAVPTIYKILLLLIYKCCTFFGLDNKLHKMHGTVHTSKNSGVFVCFCSDASENDGVADDGLLKPLVNYREGRGT